MALDDKFMLRVKVSIFDVVEVCGQLEDEDERVKLMCLLLLVERLMRSEEAVQVVI
jgi:hypothetical protein